MQDALDLAAWLLDVAEFAGPAAIVAMLLAILLLVALRPIAPAPQDDPMQEAHGDLPLLPSDARHGSAAP